MKDANTVIDSVIENGNDLMKHFKLIFITTTFVFGVTTAQGGEKMKLTSPAFEQNQLIPQQFTCEGVDHSPPLILAEIPAGTKSLAIIVDDPDAPGGMFVHWVVYNIEPTLFIFQGMSPGTEGLNDFGMVNYGGPCPPSGTHRYFHKLYALDAELNLKAGLTKQELEKAMQGHILDKAELIGLYKKE